MNSAAPAATPPPPLVVLGCGYVGAALARAERAAGAEVWALPRSEASAAALRAEGLRAFAGDLAGEGWFADFDLPAARVVNCVAAGGGGPAGYRRAYVETQRRVAAWAAGRRLDAYVYTGSASVHRQDDGGWVDEDAPAGGSPEADTLLEAEAAALAVPAGRRAVLRLGGLYGPGRHLFLDRLRAGQTTFDGHAETYLNLLHRDDAAGALRAALTAAHLPDGPYLVADGAPVRRGEITAWLAARLGAPPPTFTGQGTGRGGVRPSRRLNPARFQRLTAWQPLFPDFRAGYAPLLPAPA